MRILKINIDKISNKDKDLISDILVRNYRNAPCEMNYQAIDFIDEEQSENQIKQ